MAWLDIIDSAVKIGLGAMVAGVSALLLSQSQHHRDLSKAKVDREFEILKDVAEKTECFTQAALRYWSLASDSHRLKRSGKPVSDKKSSDLANSKATLFDLYHELTNSEAMLLLLGKRDAQSALRTYGDMVNAFRRSAVNESQPMSDPEIDTWRENILKTRERLLNELHACYQGLGP